jgi:hypothetical protein
LTKFLSRSKKGTLFTKDLEIFSTKYVLLHLSFANVNVLTIKQLVWTFSLNSKQILPLLGLQNVNLQLNLAFLAKEWHKLTTI